MQDVGDGVTVELLLLTWRFVAVNTPVKSKRLPVVLMHST